MSRKIQKSVGKFTPELRKYLNRWITRDSRMIRVSISAGELRMIHAS